MMFDPFLLLVVVVVVDCIDVMCESHLRGGAMEPPGGYINAGGCVADAVDRIRSNTSGIICKTTMLEVGGCFGII